MIELIFTLLLPIVIIWSLAIPMIIIESILSRISRLYRQKKEEFSWFSNLVYSSIIIVVSIIMMLILTDNEFDQTYLSNYSLNDIITLIIIGLIFVIITVFLNLILEFDLYSDDLNKLSRRSDFLFYSINSIFLEPFSEGLLIIGYILVLIDKINNIFLNIGEILVSSGCIIIVFNVGLMTYMTDGDNKKFRIIESIMIMLLASVFFLQTKNIVIALIVIMEYYLAEIIIFPFIKRNKMMKEAERLENLLNEVNRRVNKENYKRTNQINYTGKEFEQILEYSKSNNISVKREAIIKLGESKNVQAIPNLVAELADYNYSSEAFNSLLELKWNPTFEELKRFIEEETRGFMKPIEELTKENFINYFENLYKNYWNDYNEKLPNYDKSNKAVIRSIFSILIENHNENDFEFIIQIANFIRKERWHEGFEQSCYMIENLGKINTLSVTEKLFRNYHKSKIEEYEVDISDHYINALKLVEDEYLEIVISKEIKSKKLTMKDLDYLGFTFIDLMIEKCPKKLIEELVPISYLINYRKKGSVRDESYDKAMEIICFIYGKKVIPELKNYIKVLLKDIVNNITYLVYAVDTIIRVGIDIKELKNLIGKWNLRTIIQILIISNNSYCSKSDFPLFPNEYIDSQIISKRNFCRKMKNILNNLK